MKIRKLEYALKFIQWCVPFWFYAFVVKSDLDFGWQWKIYTITVLAIAGVYTIIHYKVDLNKIYGYEVYLIFSIITQLTAGALSFDEMKHIGLNFSSDLSIAYEQYFFIKILFNLVGVSLLPVAFDHMMKKYFAKTS
ncbi:hypothetical protein SAMN05421675_0184 [Pasteurella multocida]|uniref:hypothetical protein n=1 Tax=Pasteurella multocida TaxID=747 RepID=UPI0008EE75AF|nr:hypothetical protein [Pasteurella multocida]SFO72336.1 hypothetical protein SAMN05421675_0184 [Pasteurella multocida]VEE38083.1 Uncharacterised protein [Pasteurella multocida subsp. gallicida]